MALYRQQKATLASEGSQESLNKKGVRRLGYWMLSLNKQIKE